MKHTRKTQTLQHNPNGWPMWMKRLLSLALIWHLLAVVVPPLSVDPGGNSPVVGAAMRVLQWYVGPLYLNHGYRFFGPDPPLVSYLLRYEVVLPDGRIVTDTIPDHQRIWPRLFYHRHLMLTSRLQAAQLPPDHPLQQAMVQPYLASYAQHLAWRYKAQVVRLYLVEHRAPTPEEVLQGRKLTDPELYQSRLVYTLEQVPSGEPQP